MTDTTDQQTPAQKLVHVAKIWREKDVHYVGLKNDAQCRLEDRNNAQRTEYWARNQLRKAIDEAREP